MATSTIKTREELAKIAAISAANTLKQHGFDTKHIVAGEGTISSVPDKHWIGIWIDENPHIPVGGPHGPIWIGIIADTKFGTHAVNEVKTGLKEAGFSR
ncbi:MAG: hypothetical protein JSS75_08785 [Bacteroidetes bacterium]|nr:hypothetical protein [Bacteroidota bacterium]